MADWPKVGPVKVKPCSRDLEWLPVALSDDRALLADHAHCEKKAASGAISFIARFSTEPRLVSAMADLAAEEIAHFAEVHRLLLARGGTLGLDHGDPYAQALIALAGGDTKVDRMIDRLLIAGLIEARSYERLVLLAEHHPDPELTEMFGRLARQEGAHGELFVDLARALGPSVELVDARLEALIALEHRIIEDNPIRCAMH